MKRILLFLATNLAVVLVLSIVLNVLGVGRPVRRAIRCSTSATDPHRINSSGQ